MRIIGDLTSNHSGDAHEWFKKAFKNPKARESEFYYFTNGNKKYDSWFGVPSLPKFNWNSKELRKRFIEGKSSVVAKWLKPPFGIDGWRIDVANMTGRIRDEDMYLEVAKLVRETMVSVNPDTIMLGEYTGDAAYEVQGDGWQGAMTYANFTRPLFRWLQNPAGEEELQNIGFMSTPESGADFVESHTKFAAGFPWHVRLNNMNTLDTHDTPRFKTFTLPGAQKVAAAVQFTFPGIPMIWAGDEFGLDGFNGENSRTPLPWNNERPNDKSMIEVYSALAKIRRENAALTDGGLRFLFASENAVVYVREHKKQNILVCAARGRDSRISLPIDCIEGLAEAENIYGGGKIKFRGNKVMLPSESMTVNVWRLAN
jgi:alpha-glucosidase